MKIDDMIERLKRLQALGATRVFPTTEDGLYTDLGPFLSWEAMRDAPVEPEKTEEPEKTWKVPNVRAMQPLPGVTVRVLTSDGMECEGAWYRNGSDAVWRDANGNELFVVRYLG